MSREELVERFSLERVARARHVRLREARLDERRLSPGAAGDGVRRRPRRAGCGSRATTGTRSSFAGPRRWCRRRSGCSRSSRPSPASSSHRVEPDPAQLDGSAELLAAAADALAAVEPFTAEVDRGRAARPGGRARAQAARCVSADPDRRHGLEGLARALREHRAPRAGRDGAAPTAVDEQRRRDDASPAAHSGQMTSTAPARKATVPAASSTSATAAAAVVGGSRLGRQWRRHANEPAAGEAYAKERPAPLVHELDGAFVVVELQQARDIAGDIPASSSAAASSRWASAVAGSGGSPGSPRRPGGGSTGARAAPRACPRPARRARPRCARGG